MRREERMKRLGIALLLGLLLICLVVAISESRQQRILEKINYELQVNSDKLQEVNDTYYQRITEQQEQINQLQESLERVLSVSEAEEIEKIQRVVMAEARGGGLRDAMAVTQTILDRSQQWGLSGTDVIAAPAQYADPYTGEINDMVKLAFELVYVEGYRVFGDRTTHFYNADLCSPEWATGKVLRGEIGAHRYMF